MIVTKRKPAQVPDDIRLSLPWLATGRLSAAESRKLRAALARDAELARDYAAIQEEYNETILLHDRLGAPSARAMHNLFAGIEAEPRPVRVRPGFAARMVAVLSPRMMAFAAATALVLLLAQAALMGLKIF